MNIRRYITTASVVSSLAFGFAGSAFADTITISGTGADSTQKVEIDNSSDVIVTNTNDVHVVNANFQEAKSGNVEAEKNTSIGGNVGSGEASNTNGAATTVAVSNNSTSVVPGGGAGGGAGGGLGEGTPGMGGSVQGAATVGGLGGGAVLPEVGATFPVDVSALRAAWHPQTNAATAGLAKGSRMFTAAMLITATLLSVLGALGSAFYARRRQVRV